MLLHYCFWSHITFPSASPGVLERKRKELQQTVILHLLPGCSTPLSKGMDGSQAQRRKSIHRALHNLLASSTALIIFCCSLDRTQQFLRNPGFEILFQGESRSVSCSAWSCDVCPQKSPAGLLTQPGNSLSENREHGMIKGVWQELFAPFLTLPASSSSSVVWAWILSKPSATESLCQFLLAPSSSCGLGSSTRKINTLISCSAAALRSLPCLLWDMKLLQATQRPQGSLLSYPGGISENK